MKLNNTYLGFTNNLKPMQKAKVEKTLDKLVRYNNKVYSNKEFILTKLQEGYTPEVEENYSYYSSKTGDYTKPKTDYRIGKDNFYNSITKTEYDFANYLIDNDLIVDENINTYIESEKAEIEKENQLKLEQELKEQLQQQEQERAKQNFENWLNNQVNNYNDSEKLSLAIDIFLNEIEQYNELYIKKLLILIENIENPLCKANLKEWLHNGNTTSKKVFFHVTGVKLPTTNKETMSILDNIKLNDFQGMISYKKRQIKDITLERFYKLVTKPEVKFIEVEAEPFEKYGLNMFICKENNKYLLSEAISGCLMTSTNTKKELMDSLKDFVEMNTIEKVQNMINQLTEKYGVSPKYKDSIAV